MAPPFQKSSIRHCTPISNNMIDVCFQVVGRDLVNRKASGSIVNVSSILSERASAYYPLYGIAKAGVNQMTRTMAFELAPHNVS